MTAAELVERVARAIATRHSAFDTAECDYWAVISECSKDHWCKRDYRILARAAIAETLAAIREPTEAMIEAGDTEMEQPQACAMSVSEEVWRTMIDALAAEIREGL